VAKSSNEPIAWENKKGKINHWQKGSNWLIATATENEKGEQLTPATAMGKEKWEQSTGGKNGSNQPITMGKEKSNNQRAAKKLQLTKAVGKEKRKAAKK